MEAALRAGIAIYNAEEFHAAHDAWEEPWLGLEAGTEDERLLHGLIQFSAAIHHATEGNSVGAFGLAESAREYLAGLEGHRGVNTRTARKFLSVLANDPDITGHAPPKLTIEGQAIALDAVRFEVGAIAARVLAAEYGYDVVLIERGIEFARRDLAAGEEASRFVTLVLEFARTEGHRGTISKRLRGHVERREARETDRQGLFEE